MDEDTIAQEVTLDPQRQEQARAYARISRRLMLVDIALGGVYLLAWLVFGLSESLRDFTLQVMPVGLWGREWLLVAVFAALFGGISLLLNLPLSYYSGFVLPHQFEISNQTRTGWITDQVKGLLVGALIGLPVLEIIYLILRRYPQNWWLWAAAFLLLFDVLMANLAPVILMPLFNKFTPLGEEHAALKKRLLTLAERAGTTVSGVYKFDLSRRSKAANAALTGLGSTRRIILGDTLLDEFSDDEIEVVLAHELAHHVHKDIPTGIAVGALTTLVGLYLASLGLKWGVSALGFGGPADVAAMPLLMLVFSLYGLLTMPLGNLYSRWRERRADQYALQTTGMGAAYASALTRLANQNLADVDPEPWVEYLLHSHPALSKRIAMAESYRDDQI